MPFFMVDDQLHINRKAQALIDMGKDGLAAMGLWTLAGSQTQAGLGDGQVASSTWRLLGDKRLFTKLAQHLVTVGLWEERTDGWEYHDWFDIGYAPGEKVKLNRKRTKELKNPAIVEAVKARDGDKCRYCGRKIDWKVRNADHGATYDHVIPGMAAGVSNLVVACRKCNQRKAQRTPEQAAMSLLPPPSGPDSDQTSGQTLVQTFGQTPDQKTAIPHRARYRDRSGSGSGPGLGEVTPQGPAGEAPPIPDPPGHTGSPWHNWHGPPPPDLDQTQCPTHGRDLPCPQCPAEHYERESQ